MAGLWPADRPRAEAEAYIPNLRYAAEAMAKHDITMVIEPINTRDIPGYFLNTTTQGIAILDKVDRPNARLQLDLYHCQIMGRLVAARPCPAFRAGYEVLSPPPPWPSAPGDRRR